MQTIPVTHVTFGPLIVGAVASAGLLFGYRHVLDGAVRQGDLRRVAMADHARSVWRCNALRGEADRKDCLSKLQVPSRGAL
jgi:hypothetical protein